jgi:hypothetical protein
MEEKDNIVFMKNRVDRWLIEFVLLIIISASLSGIAYALQFYVFSSVPFELWGIYGRLIRTIRMILIYVLPVLWFVRRHNGSWRDLGVTLPSSHKFLSIFGGIGVYLIAVVIFLKYRIFFGGWYYPPWYTVWINLVLIGIMASITDFWTRGFILFELSRRYNKTVAIIGQNLTWFMLHLYEIELLNSYIGYAGAILLTLTLGILGDMIALKTKSIIGLMIGHVILNLAIILAARGVIVY